MRLMFGVDKSNPTLLVDVDQKEYTSSSFEFCVVNGAWRGKFNNGQITVITDQDNETSIPVNVKILCTDQDRLRGNYQDVFDNFSNPDYKAPENIQFIVPDEWEDDIAF